MVGIWHAARVNSAQKCTRADAVEGTCAARLLLIETDHMYFTCISRENEDISKNNDIESGMRENETLW